MNMSAIDEAWYMLKGWQDEETSLTDELDPSRGKREGEQFEQDVPPHPDYANMAPQELEMALDEINSHISDLQHEKHDIELALQTSASEGIEPQTAGGATMGADADLISELISQGKLPKGFKLG